MLKKLQKKFIIINMSLVGIVLLLVFVTLVVSNYRQNAETVQAAMVRTLQMKGQGDPNYNPLPEIGRQPERDDKEAFPYDPESNFIPTVTVIVDAQGNTRVDGAQLATIDEALLNEAVALVLSSDSDTGILSGYDLRYLRGTPPADNIPNDKGQNGTDDLSFKGGSTANEIRIVFADRSYELSGMQHLVLTSLLIGGLSLVALFFISLGLSKLTIRPVQKAWEQQRQFVADASHELKTPLTVILANTGILERHPSDTIEAQKKWVDSTKAEGERMRQLIDDMLFLAKSDSDRLPQVLSRVDFSDSLWSCLLTFEALAYERGLSLNTEIAPDVFVDGDGAQLKQLILILLDNACKYSGSHGIITVTLNHLGTMATLSVHNTGDPIPLKALPHIFERFYRVDVSRVRAEGGYGLGLSIAKTIADAHHASLDATSSAEAGTTFTFTIPLSRETG